ncbi:MAG: hydrogenase formation protein HypD [Bacillota bacterium]
MGKRRSLTLMEVCGTHTVAVARHGLRTRLRPGVRLVSGPGCPVCVTGTGVQRQAAGLARSRGVVLYTYPDLLRRPLPLSGTPARPALSAWQALEYARSCPRTRVVFFATGFETTAATVAATLREARSLGLGNFHVLSAARTILPALTALLSSGSCQVDGLLCPGHVSAIIGSIPYRRLERFGVPAVVAGFDRHQLQRGLAVLLQLAEQGGGRVVNAYPEVVRPHGNSLAQEIMAEVFVPSPAYWRGLGTIEGSGLALGPAYHEFDALALLESAAGEEEADSECRCGDVLRGALEPWACPRFGRECTPARPAGPCMVSSEGACAALYTYGR